VNNYSNSSASSRRVLLNKLFSILIHLFTFWKKKTELFKTKCLDYTKEILMHFKVLFDLWPFSFLFNSGEYCEVELDQPCPATWWGYPVCGPCSCDVDKGYDPNCNKTNGQCVCQVSSRHCSMFHLFFSFCPNNLFNTSLFVYSLFGIFFRLFLTTTGESLPTGQRGRMSGL